MASGIPRTRGIHTIVLDNIHRFQGQMSKKKKKNNNNNNNNNNNSNNQKEHYDILRHMYLFEGLGWTWLDWSYRCMGVQMYRQTGVQTDGSTDRREYRQMGNTDVWKCNTLLS